MQKLLKNSNDYNPSTCATVWDGVCTEVLPEMEKLIYAQKWGFMNQSKKLSNSIPITSWGIDILNFNPSMTGKTVKDLEKAAVKNLPGVVEEYPYIEVLWNKIRELAKGDLRLLRIIANGHTYGLGDNIHIDASDAPESQNRVTFIYYFNPEWAPEWDGQTLIYANNGDILKSILKDNYLKRHGRTKKQIARILKRQGKKQK